MKTTSSHPLTSSTSKFTAASLAIFAALPMLAKANDGATEFNEPNLFDKIWSFADLYENDANPYLEVFKLRGMYQGQYWNVEDDHGSQSNWEDRRSRLGFDAKLFDKKVEVRIDAQSNDKFNDAYDGLVDAYIRWKPNSWISVTVGKTKPLIGQVDWVDSITTAPTFERSQIFNQLGINRAGALTVEVTTEDYIWRAGVYTNSTPATTADPKTKISSGAFGEGEFGDFTGGVSYTLGVGYDFKHLLNLEKAEFHLDWLHSNRQAGDLVMNKYDDILSTTFWVKEGYASVVVEGFYATGGDSTTTPGAYDGSDVFGFYIQPTYDLIPKKLQVVGRFSYATSDGSFGVFDQSRYEKKVAANKGVGDAYISVYGGLQYFIYGDKLKLMSGVEWARLQNPNGDSYDGTTLISGIRLSF